MNLSNKLEEFSRLISKKSKDCLASIHIDMAGLIRLGETSEEMLENFNHEHIHYFYVTTINKIAKRYGLEVFKVFGVKAKGGSIRVYISHNGMQKIHSSVKLFINKEKKFN